MSFKVESTDRKSSSERESGEQSIDISVATDEDASAWNTFVANHPEIASHHANAWAWRSIQQSVFGHTPYYFIARANHPDRPIIGILPCVHVSSILFGRSLISLPYLNAGGVVAERPETEDALVRSAIKLSGELGVDYLELRQRQPHANLEGSLEHRSHKISMQLPLQANPEDLFATFAPKLRSQVRRPTKSGMYVVVSGESKSAYECLRPFYEVFSEHMRDLGTPVYPRTLFEAVEFHFRERMRVITVWHEKTPVAAGITLGQGNCVEIPWAASLRRYGRHSPNMLLYWEAIKHACLDGYALFDFGRSSPDTGTFRFKQQWNPTPLQLHWYYHKERGGVPDVNPASPKYSFVVGCWKRLPLPVANLVGPWLTRGIP